MKYDCIVIGGGPAGYVAAIRLAQNGKRVACVDLRSELGGTCLNVGCIPSKVLLEISHLYHDMRHKTQSCGIIAKDISYNIEQIMAAKDKKVSGLTGGIKHLFKKNKIDFIQGMASFVDKNTIVVNGKHYNADDFIIATGSESSNLPGITVDEKRIVSSTGALSLSEVPKKMLIIGAGYIGLELGAVYQRLGSQIEVVEYLDRILPTMDAEVASALQKIFVSQGVTFSLSSKLVKATVKGNSVEVELEDVKSAEKHTSIADVVLVAVGRRPNTGGLNLEAVSVIPDNRGFIKVNEKFQTEVPNIYAIGDVIGGAMLAHKASDEAVVVADIIAKNSGNHMDYGIIPGIMYTHPEVAAVGKTEEELKKENIEYKVGKFPFMANSRAKTVDETAGFVKILSCAKTDRILGCHIISKDAGTLIHEVVTAMAFRGSSEDLALICHAHPTLNEAIKEAALDVEKAAIHI